jgi:hypothetical protein
MAQLEGGAFGPFLQSLRRYLNEPAAFQKDSWGQAVAGGLGHNRSSGFVVFLASLHRYLTGESGQLTYSQPAAQTEQATAHEPVAQTQDSSLVRPNHSQHEDV